MHVCVCMYVVYCHENMTMKFCRFHKFLFYDLYFNLFSLNVSINYYSTITKYRFALFVIYSHHYPLPKTDTSLSSLQQVLQSRHRFV